MLFRISVRDLAHRHCVAPGRHHTIMEWPAGIAWIGRLSGSLSLLKFAEPVPEVLPQVPAGIV